MHFEGEKDTDTGISTVLSNLLFIYLLLFSFIVIQFLFC